MATTTSPTGVFGFVYSLREYDPGFEPRDCPRGYLELLENGEFLDNSLIPLGIDPADEESWRGAGGLLEKAMDLLLGEDVDVVHVSFEKSAPIVYESYLLVRRVEDLDSGRRCCLLP